MYCWANRVQETHACSKQKRKTLIDGLCISARDFIALDERNGGIKPLFIDGLDEARARQ